MFWEGIKEYLISLWWFERCRNSLKDGRYGPRLLKMGWVPRVGEACAQRALGQLPTCHSGCPQMAGKRICKGWAFWLSKQTWFWRLHKQVKASESKDEHFPLCCWQTKNNNKKTFWFDSGCLSFGTTGIWGETILCHGGRPVPLGRVAASLALVY